jgi:GNAT superfamily N-acetyltransferase
MGVLSEYHRHGVGRAMLRAAEARLAAEGVEFLQVKTRGPSKPDEGYDKTRAFTSRTASARSRSSRCRGTPTTRRC